MGRFMSPDPSGLFYADPSNPQSLNLYSYAQNNPLTNIDPTGMDCIHTNNDTGAFEGFESGDCDNSTEALANTGHYIDGTVNTIYTSTGNANGVVEGFSGTSDSGNLMQGTFATALDQQLSPVQQIDPDQERITALVQGVAQDTQSLPWVCNVSLTLRAQIPKTPIAVGASLDRNGLQASARLRAGSNAAGEQINVTTNGQKMGAQYSVPIPDTPFRATLGLGTQHPTVGASTNLPWGGNTLNAGASVSLGYLGDPSCR